DALVRKSFASVQTKQTDEATLEQAKANLAQAQAAEQLAQLNLDRSVVRASVNGQITNFQLRPGDYATAGTSVAALIDTDTIHIDGYFEETKLPRIRIGDRASVHLMGAHENFLGHVESIAGGIQDQERSDTPGKLADVTPTFSWVRLA
ncbi:HlyD family efflux transporter periplasmic adaptor subunit, partial [Thioclava sp. BHET1]